jgi:hypothetical protein
LSATLYYDDLLPSARGRAARLSPGAPLMSGDPGGRGARGSIGGRLAAAARDAFRPAAAAARDAPPPPRPFDPEAEVELKREWAARHAPRASRDTGDAGDAGDGADAFGATPPGGAPSPYGAGDPSPRLFEHFAVVGLPPGVDVRAVSADIRTYQNARAAGGRAHGMTSITPGTPRDGAAAPAPGRRGAYAGLRGPACAAEVLFSYSPGGGGGGAGGALPADLADALPAFCFPHGARPELLERTPSLSALAEVVCGQPAATREDHSFVFLLKVADGARPLYGVCALAAELVHRPPALGRTTTTPPPPPLRRYLVAAPRCYCLLSHHPFFELHFRVLQALLGLERLDRMAAFAAELAAPPGAAPRSPAPSPPPSAFAAAAAEAAPPAPPAAGGAEPAAAASLEPSLEPGAAAAAPRGGEGEGPASSYASTEASSSGSSAAELATPTGGGGALGAASGDLDLNLDELALGARPRRPPAGGALAPGALPYCEDEDEEEGGAAAAAAGDTPNAPLLPATPFFTPAGSGGAGGATPASGGRARRAARRHGAAETPAAPAALGLGSAAACAAAAAATLGDALAGAAARLAPSPPGAGGDAEGDDWRWADAGGDETNSAPAADAALAEARAAAPSGAAVLAAYAAARVPAPGETLVFAPSPALQPIRFARPAAPAAPRAGPGSRPGSPGVPGARGAALGAALAGAPPDLDAAAALEPWAVAAACRALSLDSLLTFITAALLERQVRLLAAVCLSYFNFLLTLSSHPFHPPAHPLHLSTNQLPDRRLLPQRGPPRRGRSLPPSAPAPLRLAVGPPPGPPRRARPPRPPRRAGALCRGRRLQDARGRGALRRPRARERLQGPRARRRRAPAAARPRRARGRARRAARGARARGRRARARPRARGLARRGGRRARALRRAAPPPRGDRARPAGLLHHRRLARRRRGARIGAAHGALRRVAPPARPALCARLCRDADVRVLLRRGALVY